jgi:hypothetical protein
MEYTVQIQAYGGSAGSAASGAVAFSPERGIWQAMHPAESVTGTSADEVAQDVAAIQDVAEGTGWRVAVWEGADADTGIEPAATYESDHAQD